MGIEHIRWRKHLREFRWGLFVGPFSTPLYIAAGILIVVIATAGTGIHPLIAAAIGAMMIAIINPKRRLMKIKNDRADPEQL